MKKRIKKYFTSLPHTFVYNCNKFLNRKGFERDQSLKIKDVVGLEYSFKGFEENQCIFIHIPKAAGVSVNLELFHNLGGGHRWLRDYKLIYSKKELDQYFKFTIVRNPWDRLLSAYFFLKEGGFDENDKRWFEQNLSHYSDFEDFVVNWLRKKNIYSWNHFIPQFEFVCINNKLAVDKFYKFEEIVQGINDIGRKIK
jgi:hypothetical protein